MTMQTETMRWAGPLPDEVDPTAEAMWEGSMTFACHSAARSYPASPPSNGIDPIVWAGPLPPTRAPVRSPPLEKRRFTAAPR
jgi:hypothetical protein